MPQFSTLEATSTGEKVVNVGKLWSITAFVRSTGWLISPASVEAITLQLQSACSFQGGCLCHPPCLGTHLCQNPFSLYDDTCQTPLCLSGDFPECQLWLFERKVLGNVRHVNPLTVAVFKLIVLIFASIVFSVVVIVHVVVLCHIGAVSPIIVRQEPEWLQGDRKSSLNRWSWP